MEGGDLNPSCLRHCFLQGGSPEALNVGLSYEQGEFVLCPLNSCVWWGRGSEETPGSLDVTDFGK